ncbi:MAG: acyl-ACP--UDP-N-acetylglucosamine O-acyltransferase [Pseudomonadota bacterium]
MSTIHPTALVEEGARIAPDAVIGPFCHVSSQADLAAGVQLRSHVVVSGRTSIGEGTIVYPFACLGTQPQDLKYEGEDSQLIIGKNCMIREHVTVHIGTKGGGMVTRVGDDALLMIGTHVAHDCQLGKSVILANHVNLAGHVTVGDYAILGGMCGVHQFVEIGAHAFIAGMVGVERDVIPFGMVEATKARGRLTGLNHVGLRRRNFDRKQIRHLQQTLDNIFTEQGTLAERIKTLRTRKNGDDTLSHTLLDFIERSSKRGLLVLK